MSDIQIILVSCIISFLLTFYVFNIELENMKKTYDRALDNLNERVIGLTTIIKLLEEDNEY